MRTPRLSSGMSRAAAKLSAKFSIRFALFRSSDARHLKRSSGASARRSDSQIRSGRQRTLFARARLFGSPTPPHFGWLQLGIRLNIMKS
jgi:hypothetical protein